MRTIVYGASDDLIEVEGAIREEFNPNYSDDGPTYLGFSNGVVLKVEYDDEGTWAIAPRAGHSLVEVVFARGEEQAADKDGCPGYSDKAIISGEVTWVVCGQSWAKGGAR